MDDLIEMREHERDLEELESLDPVQSEDRMARYGIGSEREDDIEELIRGHEDDLTTELQEILNEEHQETQRNVSPYELEEDETGPMPISAIKDLLKKWADESL
ncbi:uncharacterized protein TNCV_2655811 [Trichonephila clavipes]|nr:uncharacterized protein TNCV_2655811 [Trichonephila clavipes]